MALTELTKVTGPGIHTLSNILSHNIKSSGIITATKFSGPLDSIGGNFAGVITATNGVFSGNVSIGGTLTYEDVTNIDSVGIITANQGIHVGAGVSAVGVGTFGGLDIGGDIDVDGHTELDNANVSGVVTFTGTSGTGIQLLDDRTIQFGSAAASRTSILYESSTSRTKIRNYNDTLEIGYRTTEIHYLNQARLTFAGGNTFSTAANTNFLGANYHAGWVPADNKFQINDNAKLAFGSQADTTIHHNNSNLLISNTTGNIDVTGNVVLNNDISVDGHTNLDNVSVAGVSTFTGTVNLSTINSTASVLSIHNTADRVLIKGSNRIDIADNMVRFQNRAQNAALLEAVAGASGYVKLYHNDNVVASVTLDALTVTGRTSNSGMVEIASNQGANNNDRFRIHKTSAASRLTIQAYSTGSWVENIRITAGGAVELKHSNGTTHLQTTSTGAQIDTILKLYGAAGNPGKLQLQEGGALSEIRVERSTDTSSALLFGTEISGTTATRWKIDTAGHFIPGAVGSYDIGSTGAEIGNVFLADDKKVFLGSDQDFTLHHNNAHAIVKNTTGRLYVLSDDLWFKNQADNSTSARFLNGDSVLLYYADNLKLQTLPTGISVTGKVVASGEIEAAQDYPNFRPTLDLNFAAQKKLDPRITYQRTGPASFTNEFGKVVLIGDNAPRFDHDPVTRESKGLLIEETRTNYAVYSTKVSNEYGSYYNMINGAVLVNNAGVAPDGTNTATKMYPASSGAARGIEDIYTLPGSSASWTTSIYVKAAGHTGWIGLYGVNGSAIAHFNPSTGTKGGTTSGGDITDYDIIDAGNGWYRIYVTMTENPSSGNEYFYIYFADANNSVTVTHSGTNGILMWGLQVEQGSFPTSYIPTYGSTATRGYEAVTLEGTDFSDIFETEFKEFSLVADYDNTQTDDGTNYGIIDLWGEASGYDDRIEWFKDNSSPYHIETRTFGGGNPLFANGTLSASSKAKSQRFATSWYVPDYSNTSSRRFVVSMGGEAVDIIPDNSGTTVPLLTRMGIGCNPTRLDLSPGLLHFKRLMVYNKTLSDGQLQNLSAQ